MSIATRAVREQGFQPLECDIPDELTIAEYRRRRRRRAGARRGGRRRLAALIGR